AQSPVDAASHYTRFCPQRKIARDSSECPCSRAGNPVGIISYRKQCFSPRRPGLNHRWRMQRQVAAKLLESSDKTLRETINHHASIASAARGPITQPFNRLRSVHLHLILTKCFAREVAYVVEITRPPPGPRPLQRVLPASRAYPTDD